MKHSTRGENKKSEVNEREDGMGTETEQKLDSRDKENVKR